MDPGTAAAMHGIAVHATLRLAAAAVCATLALLAIALLLNHLARRGSMAGTPEAPSPLSPCPVPQPPGERQ